MRGRLRLADAALGVSQARLPVLDAIRFLAAAVVALAHFGLPVLDSFWITRHTVPNFPQQVLIFFLNGGSAVMVFFVLSGFCIHLPYVGERPLNLREFYLRRFLRLGIPLLVWAPFLLIVKEPKLSVGVLWSLWAELIYYALYPLLRRVIQLWLWELVYLSAVVGAIVVLLTFPPQQICGLYSPAVAWVLGLPVWLLGVRLAEQWPKLKTLKPLGAPALWALRLSLFLVAWVASLLSWRGVSDGWTQNVFGVLAAYWLGQELVAAQSRTVPQWLVAAGGMSYSYYLIHSGVGYSVAGLLGLGAPLERPVANVVAHTTALLAAYGFARWVEKPAHALARRLSISKA